MDLRGKFPDVLAYHIANTVGIPEREGLLPRVIRTSGPRGMSQGPLRVVRQRLIDDGTVLELTVAAEDWGKEV